MAPPREREMQFVPYSIANLNVLFIYCSIARGPDCIQFSIVLLETRSKEQLLRQYFIAWLYMLTHIRNLTKFLTLLNRNVDYKFTIIPLHVLAMHPTSISREN